jgi:hypothetical protein
LFAIVLILTISLGLVFEAGAESSPGPVPTPSNPGYDPITGNDVNTQDHYNGTVTTNVATGSVVAVESNGNGLVLIGIGRDQDNNPFPINSIQGGAFNSTQGAEVNYVTINSTAAVTVKPNAFKGSNVKKLRIKTTKVSFKKNAFKGTKVKKLKIYLKKVTKASDVRVTNGSFAGLDKNAKIIVNKKMSDAQFEKLKKKLEKAGFKGKIVRGN